MNCKIGLCLLVGLVLATCSGAHAGGIRRFRQYYNKDLGSSTGGGSAAAAAAAGPNGVSSSASVAGSGYDYGYPRGPATYPNQVPYVQQQPAFRPARQPHIRRGPPAQPAYYEDGGLLDDSAFQPYAAPVYAPPPRQYHYAPPQQRRPAHYPPQYGFVKGARGPAYSSDPATLSAAAAAAAAAGGHKGGAAAAAAAAAGGHNGGAAAAAAAMSGGRQQKHYAPEQDYRTSDAERYYEHFEEPETENHYEAAAGTMNGRQGEFEQGSYARQTETSSGHEDGREDGDHYYNAQAYGKSADQNDYVAYNDDDDDEIHTPNLYRKKKSKTNFVKSSNKQHRETGSGVVAHDKHSAFFNKDYNKVKENVNQSFAKGADGLVKTENMNSKADVDDEDEMAYDTRGLGTFVGVDGVAHPKRVSQVPTAH